MFAKNIRCHKVKNRWKVYRVFYLKHTLNYQCKVMQREDVCMCVTGISEDPEQETARRKDHNLLLDQTLGPLAH